MVIWLSIFAVYFIFILFLTAGIYKWQNKKTHQTLTPHVSVIVAMRNEALNLSPLIESLANQNYSGVFEVILVDDHSNDNSLEVAHALRQQYTGLQLKIQVSSLTGKKQAITTGVEHATGEIILTADADCELAPDWIEDMVNSFDTHTQLVAGAVKLKTNNTFWSKLQAVEFASVMATGLGALAWGLPVMCNGASLAFRKAAFVSVKGYAGNVDIPSGDDEFLMRSILRVYPHAVRIVNHGNNVCTTQPAASLNQLFQQRIRWASKWKANTAWGVRLLALLVFLFQFMWLPALAMALFTHSSTLLVMVLVKIILELVLLRATIRAMRQPFSFSAFTFLQIMYAPYVIIVALCSQLVGYSWKGRPVNRLR